MPSARAACRLPVSSSRESRPCRSWIGVGIVMAVLLLDARRAPARRRCVFRADGARRGRIAGADGLARVGASMIGLDAMTLLFTCAVAAVASALIALVPALQASALRPVDAMKAGGGRGTAGISGIRCAWRARDRPDHACARPAGRRRADDQERRAAARHRHRCKHRTRADGTRRLPTGLHPAHERVSKLATTGTEKQVLHATGRSHPSAARSGIRRSRQLSAGLRRLQRHRRWLRARPTSRRGQGCRVSA